MKASKAAFAVLATVSVSALSTPALGHTPPRPLSFEAGADGANTIVSGLSEGWGLLVSTDGGESFGHVCGSRFGSPSAREPVRVAVSASGTAFVAASFDGLWLSHDGLCAFEPEPMFEGELVTDVAEMDGAVYVVTSTGELVDGGSRIRAQLYRSIDDGESWETTGPLPEQDASYRQIVASGGTLHVVVRRLQGASPQNVVFRSDDGGTSWSLVTLPLSDTNRGTVWAHPTDPDLLVVSAYPMSLLDPEPGWLYVSTDGGDSWPVHTATETPVTGVAFSPDGAELAIGGPSFGFRRVAIDALSSVSSDFTGDAVFQRDTRVYGLSWTPAGLFAGVDSIAPDLAPAMIMVSQDGGASFESRLDVCAAAPVSCGDSTDCGLHHEDLADAYSPLCEPEVGAPSSNGGAGGSGGAGGTTAGGGAAGSVSAMGGGTSGSMLPGDAPASAADDNGDVRIDDGCSVSAMGAPGRGAGWLFGVVLGLAGLYRRPSLLPSRPRAGLIY